MIIVALSGRTIGFPPLIRNDTDESILIEENAWILKMISWIPSDGRWPLVDETETRFSRSFGMITL